MSCSTSCLESTSCSDFSSLKRIRKILVRNYYFFSLKQYWLHGHCRESGKEDRNLLAYSEHRASLSWHFHKSKRIFLMIPYTYHGSEFATLFLYYVPLFTPHWCYCCHSKLHWPLDYPLIIKKVQLAAGILKRGREMRHKKKNGSSHHSVFKDQLRKMERLY